MIRLFHLMKNIDQIRFQIDQLRKDKIIYAVEAVVVNTCCILVFILINFYPFSELIRTLISNLVTVIAVVYSVFVGVGNLIRLQKIKKLEKKLE